MKEVILTADGYKKLQREIDVLRNDKRREVAEANPLRSGSDVHETGPGLTLAAVGEHR